jgi:hypothetical protein
MEVLTAYVRQNAPWQEIERGKEENKKKIAKGPDTEIQAILTVLGRRKRGGKREKKGQPLDLRGANFMEAHLEDANFYASHIEGASFVAAHVAGASFFEAHVEGAHFNAAHVEGAYFDAAHLEGASFYAAHVKGARFNAAHVEGAIFREAIGLEVGQFGVAEGLVKARFDDEFTQKLKSAGRLPPDPESDAAAPETPPIGRPRK